MSFDEDAQSGCAASAAHQEIAFPVAWDGTVSHLGRTLFDGDHLGDCASTIVLSQPVLTSVRPMVAEGAGDLFFEFSAAQDVEILVKGLVADAHGGVIRIILTEAFGNLLGRPALVELLEDVASETEVLLKLTASAGSVRGPECFFVSLQRAVDQPVPLCPAAFSGDGTDVSFNPAANLPQAAAGSQQAANLFTFLKTDVSVRTHATPPVCSPLF